MNNAGPTADWVATACNPELSVVVEACAGSGKTWLLTARLFRLLLEGARPEQLLAITFTRKAAQEMKARLYGLLRECALAQPERLAQLLGERGAQATPQNMDRARALAGMVLTHPRGVTIDTFHGWFASLCQLAPLGLGFSRQSEPVEQVDGLISNAVAQLVLNATEHAIADAFHRKLLSALDTLVAKLGRVGMEKVLADALRNRAACELVLGKSEPMDWPGYFGVSASERWPQDYFTQPNMAQQWNTMTAALGKGTATQQKLADAVQGVFLGLNQGELEPGEAFEQLRKLWLTDKNTVRKNSRIPTGGQLDAISLDEQSYTALADSLGEGLVQALGRGRDSEDMACTIALFDCLQALLEIYHGLKAEQSVCDFDDLESTALQLMMQADLRAYVLQKLDARVRHLLVDEFQDTNPVQWNILKLWLEDYSQAQQPTVFLVGDPKQSIYRFRRAEAQLFDHARAWLEQQFSAKTLQADDTRRCEPAVVNVVNRVLVDGARNGNTPFRPHQSLVPQPHHNPQGPGLVLYPVHDSAQDPMAEARAVVATLQAWLASGEIKALSQVMVLVRTHGTANPLIRALREAGLQYSTKDRGERYESIVWTDTISLLGFLCDPEQNLHTLALLRSPLLGLGNVPLQQMLHLAHAQGQSSVWATFKEFAGQPGPGQPWAGALAMLQNWLRLARQLPPFEVLSRVFTDVDARQRYLDVSEPRERHLLATHWDWLQAWVLGLNKGRFLNMQAAFDAACELLEFHGSDGEGEQAGADSLRILTVHAAKGLECDRVWLFNACHEPRAMGSRAGLLQDWPLGELRPTALTVMVNTEKTSPARQAVQAREAQAQADEADHLLYVALTRARHSVHVSGSAKQAKPKGWYAWLMAHAEGPADYPDQPDVCAHANPQGELPFNDQATWSLPAYPSLPALPKPVGQVMPRPDSAELRMGTAVHGLLELINPLAQTDPQAWLRQAISQREDVMLPLQRHEQEIVFDTVLALVSKPELQDWFYRPVQAFNELEWVSAEGRALRADRVIELADCWLVMDYKWAVNPGNEQGYRAQVLEYMTLVDATLNADGQKPSRGVLIDRHGQVYWVSSV